ncbi:hypothetical protein ADEAN_000098300 [Angomonas deanei]|uniref:Uncharacterized protein n=1 Tax=Angomonas deanei TaxID=59799 RepID=A0A7G2C1D9_9TRYP|nr:hypothetical protein ADEAN_000098300 [Angomonas deanei]
MHQFIVEKQGRINQHNWHGAVLSVTRAAKPIDGSDETDKSGMPQVVLYLSKKDRPDLLLYHKMYLCKMEVYPEYNLTKLAGLSKEEFAEKCFCLKGYILPGPLHPDYTESEPKDLKPFYGGWILRVATRSDVERLAEDVHNMTSNV